MNMNVDQTWDQGFPCQMHNFCIRWQLACYCHNLALLDDNRDAGFNALRSKSAISEIGSTHN
ncbi:hypothetical protein [Yersinia pestis]|uniref:hypothetical protein n=1 Tax=Yersinia pestis TaxID=632 RepID=UPI002FCC9F48